VRTIAEPRIAREGQIGAHDAPAGSPAALLDGCRIRAFVCGCGQKMTMLQQTRRRADFLTQPSFKQQSKRRTGRRNDRLWSDDVRLSIAASGCLLRSVAASLASFAPGRRPAGSSLRRREKTAAPQRRHDGGKLLKGERRRKRRRTTTTLNPASSRAPHSSSRRIRTRQSTLLTVQPSAQDLLRPMSLAVDLRRLATRRLGVSTRAALERFSPIPSSLTQAHVPTHPTLQLLLTVSFGNIAKEFP
jgi:hypothetical protein